MTTLLAGVGPAGRGVLTAMHTSGLLPDVCDDGLVVVDPEVAPGGGALRHYNVRSDSAAIVFAECVTAVRHDPDVARSPALATVLALPEGESVALPHVGRLLSDGAAPLLREIRGLGADVRLGSRVSAVHPHASGGATVCVSDWAGHAHSVEADRLILAVGGTPHVPTEVARLQPRSLRHSDELLRPAGLAEALDALPPNPRVVVVGRAHSAFSVADRLLSSSYAESWGAASVTVATRGGVRVTYPDVRAARADRAVFTEDDVCPQSGRVWRLCGLRGDAARRYRLARDGLDPRLVVEELVGDALAARASTADLVVAATGYRTAALGLVPGAVSAHPDGSLADRWGRRLRGIRTIGLGSGSRRGEGVGEPSYTGPVDGVWYYQTVLAPAMLDSLFGAPEAGGVACPARREVAESSA